MTDPMITTADLAEKLGQPNLRLLDASWHLDGRDGRGPWREAHIPGARFFDIDAISDQHTPLPHMLPTPQAFAAALGVLGVAADDAIVVYDQHGLFSAARAWWSLRVMGACDVRVLDGGLPMWIAEGRPLETGEPANHPAVFVANLQPRLLKTLETMEAMVRTGGEQIVDVRPGPRFRGEVAEPRAGLRGGHMPGAKNLPYAELIASDGTLKTQADLRTVLTAAGIDPERATTATCGSGVTAPILALAMARLGHDAVAVYDGSWTEWGGRPDTPVATGA
jgi:thiosulfate/3-mercaptopyruvate sulfurtransferase